MHHRRRFLFVYGVQCLSHRVRDGVEIADLVEELFAEFSGQQRKRQLKQGRNGFFEVLETLAQGFKRG